MGIFDRLDQLAGQLGDLIGSDDVRAHVELGAAYLERADLDAAIYELGLACELRPDHPRASYLLGVAYARRGNDELALEALGRAAAVKSGFAEPHIALGELYRRRQQWEPAADEYREALDAGVGDGAVRGEVYRGLGAVYLAQRRLDKAIRELRKAAASLPEDAETWALLGRALYLAASGDRDLEPARAALEKAVSHTPPLQLASLTLGEVYLKLGRVDEARKRLEEAASGGGPLEVEARLQSSQAALAAGHPVDAQTEILVALGHAPDRPDLLVALGRINAAAGSYDAALGAFDRALVSTASSDVGVRLFFDRTSVVEEALRVALRGGQPRRAAAYAAVLLEHDPTHADALAGASLAAAESGDLPRAKQLIAPASDTLEALLARAELAGREGNEVARRAFLTSAATVSLGDPRARELLRQLYRRTTPPTELYPLLHRIHAHLSSLPELATLAPEAVRLLETLERPLLVTVMGEFNAGKSSFVNALLGEEVAPMGITPTTATINVLKYGAEAKGRVVYLDGTSRDVAWAEVPSLLRGLGADEAQRIRVVEVLYPLETLQRVHVVDTPGLNSIHPEHEETARRFITEADAVVWLFSVDQAAKASEGATLSTIAGDGKKILAVLNKIDRCEPAEQAQIIRHVTEALGDILETVVPYSAREVLLARRQSPVDEARLAKANHPALLAALEERFFSRARKIQADAARARLGGLLARARALVQPLVDADRTGPLDRAYQLLRADAVVFERDFLRTERSRLISATDEMSAACAQEVVDFVRPRSWVFGSNQAAPADRDFLLQLIDERLGAVLQASRDRVEAELDRIASTLPVTRSATEGANVHQQFRAFVRGFLRGGRVDDFFTRVLPKLPVEETAIRRALDRDAPWVNESLDAELIAPLAAEAHRAFVELESRILRARAEAELSRFDLEERVLAPLELFAAAATGGS